MIYKFFETQWKTKKPKDWICTVEQNLKHLGFEETLQDIETVKKLTLKRMLNQSRKKSQARQACLRNQNEEIEEP